MADTPRAEMVRVNGVDLAFIGRGQGEPVVFVHGSLGDYRTWGQQMEPFGERYRVIAYSRRAHWPHARPPGDAPYSITEHVADLASLIESLGLAPAHVAGTSYGAMTTLTLLVERPDLFRSAVVSEPPLLPWLARLPGGAELAQAFQETAWEPAAEAMRRGDEDKGVELFMDGILGAGAFDRIPTPVKERMMDNAPALGRELTAPPESYFPSVSPEDVARIRTPVLLVQGERSPRMFGLIVEELARLLPEAERVTIPGVSHSPHSQNAAAYNPAVLDFLARH